MITKRRCGNCTFFTPNDATHPDVKITLGSCSWAIHSDRKLPKWVWDAAARSVCNSQTENCLAWKRKHPAVIAAEPLVGD